MRVKHTHRYQRVDIAQTPKKKYIVFKCSLPDCQHYINPKLAIGKHTICWRCGESFILTSELARLAKPHCKECTKTDKKKEAPLSDQEFNELFGDLFD